MRLGIFVSGKFLTSAYWSADELPLLVPDSTNVHVYRQPLLLAWDGSNSFAGAVAEAITRESPSTQATFVDIAELNLAKAGVTRLGTLELSIDVTSAAVLSRVLHNAKAAAGKVLQYELFAIAGTMSEYARMRFKQAAVNAGCSRPLLVDVARVTGLYLHAGDKGRHRRRLLVELTSHGTRVTLVDGTASPLTVSSSISADTPTTNDYESLAARLFLGVPDDADVPSAIARLTSQFEQRLATWLETPAATAGAPRTWCSLIGGEVIEVRFGLIDLLNRAEHLNRQLAEHLTAAVNAFGIEQNALDEIVFVGGKFPTALATAGLSAGFDRANLPPAATVDPESLGAFAAAWAANELDSTPIPDLAGVLSENAERSFAILLRREDGLDVDELIVGDQLLPASATRTFKTGRADQRRLVVEIATKERDSEEWELLGVVGIGPIARPRNACPIAVTFTVDLDNVLQITAADAEFGEAVPLQDIQVSGDGGPRSVAQNLEGIRLLFGN